MELGFLRRGMRIADAILLPSALLWLLFHLPKSTSLTVWLATGALGIWLIHRLRRAIDWERTYRFSMVTLVGVAVMSCNFAWTANGLQRWFW